MKASTTVGLAVVGLVAVLGLAMWALGAESPNSGVITGQVTSANGPEAGVWVIAETSDTPTKFRKIVVTNDEGRFLLPDLPEASFSVWVRGYGLVDSEPVTAGTGDELALDAPLAATPAEAALVYPATYWGSLLRLPDESEFPGTGDEGNGIAPQNQTYGQFLHNVKGCQRCHQLGTDNTRIIPDVDQYASPIDAWDHRVQRGQRGNMMSSFMSAFGRSYGLRMFADWTTRIANGETPRQTPTRPEGIERNVVITMWNWADSVSFMHDEMSTDRRNPTVNANGPIYGVDIGNDNLTIVDPATNSARMIRVPTRDEDVPSFWPETGFNAYRDFGDTPVWRAPANPHNPMMDEHGRVWLTTQVRAAANPAWCQEGSDNPYALYYPIRSAGRHTGYYDPATETFELIETCFNTHHLQFAEDEDDTLYYSDLGSAAVVGWLKTRVYDETGDAQLAQGWCPRVLDTNGDGKITKPWNEPRGEVDPSLDTRVQLTAYGIIVSPVDDAVWAVTGDAYPGDLIRTVTGDNPPETCISEWFQVPPELGFRTRGVDVDRNGVVWLALAGSSDLASFDYRKCQVHGGAEVADGRQCDEGWTMYPVPGPTYEGTDVRVDFHYYNWVDQFNTLGLGENVPIVNGSASDALYAFLPETEEWVTLRVPYPQGFYTRGVDGRIDDPDAGWKGRGIYATYGADAAWHVEGGPREPGNLVKFQIRPDPLAD